MVERSLSMREALGSMPRFSTFCLVQRKRVPGASCVQLPAVLFLLKQKANVA